MMEQDVQKACNQKAGNLEEEMLALLMEPDISEGITNNTSILTIICC